MPGILNSPELFVILVAYYGIQGLNFVFRYEGSLPTNSYEWRSLEIFGRDKKNIFIFYNIKFYYKVADPPGVARAKKKSIMKPTLHFYTYLPT